MRQVCRYLKLGVGNPCAGQFSDTANFSTKLNVFDLDSFGKFGAEAPTGSVQQ
jgi:hypothetical protein